MAKRGRKAVDKASDDAKSAPRPRRGKKGVPSQEQGFYAEAIGEAERLLLPKAREVEGLDEEIALMRVRLASELAKNPESTTVFLRLVGQLVKAVALRYRLSGKAEGDLYESIQGVIRGIGSSIFPEGFDGA